MNHNRSSLVNLLIAIVSLLGLGVLAGAVAAWGHEDAAFLAALACLAVVSEIFDFAPFLKSRVSLSITLIFAAGVLSGLPGVVIVATAAVATASLLPNPNPRSQALFNEGMVLLNGAAHLG